MTKKQLIIMALLVAAAGTISGCVAAAVGVGAGTVAYVRGDLEAGEAAALDKVYDATVKAARQLELKVDNISKDALTATFTGKDAEKKKVRIKLTSTGEDSTKISIRIGIFGSETKSRRIYEQIKKNLE